MHPGKGNALNDGYVNTLDYIYIPLNLIGQEIQIEFSKIAQNAQATRRTRCVFNTKIKINFSVKQKVTKIFNFVDIFFF